MKSHRIQKGHFCKQCNRSFKRNYDLKVRYLSNVVFNLIFSETNGLSLFSQGTHHLKRSMFDSQKQHFNFYLNKTWISNSCMIRKSFLRVPLEIEHATLFNRGSLEPLSDQLFWRSCRFSRFKSLILTISSIVSFSTNFF